MSSRDFNVLADCMFAEPEDVARKHGLTVQVVRSVMKQYAHSYEEMLKAKNTIFKGMAEVGLRDGLAKVLQMIENVDPEGVTIYDKAGVATGKQLKPGDVMAMVQSTQVLSNIVAQLDGRKPGEPAKDNKTKRLSDQAEAKLRELMPERKTA